jgi:hypothetical protein
MTLRAVSGMVILSVLVGWSWTVSSFGHQVPATVGTHARQTARLLRCFGKAT